ncbi:hypothetical protein [Cohaesibacter marisflavi]|uniref:hypothetical protein n=1 Tax=Cohaesibacter marisflavi TaxID=655353 RepID=UPI0029C8BC10|nr:hypothetical protein [Cohaesibacter marisflavi]
MAGYGDNQVFDSLPRMRSAPEDAGFMWRFLQARHFVASFGWPVVAGSNVSGLLLVGYALLPQEGSYLFIVASTLLAVGSFLFVLSQIKRHKATKLYQTGAFQRAAALCKISASRKLFMIAHGVVWGGAAFLCASGILAGLGATLLSYIFVGGFIAVGCGHLFGVLRVKSSVFCLICCKRKELPPASLPQMTRYALQPDVRLAMDQASDAGALSSLLAIIAQDDAQANGVALRIPDFGDWPGLSLARESKLRMKGSLAPFASGCAIGLIAGGLLLLLVGLPTHSISNPHVFAPPFSAQQHTDMRSAENGKPRSELGSVFQKQQRGLSASGASGREGLSDRNGGRMAQHPLESSLNAEDVDGASSRDLANSSNDSVPSQSFEQPQGQDGLPPDLLGEDASAQAAMQSGDASPHSGATGGGLETALQGLADRAEVFPDGSLAKDRIKIEQPGQDGGSVDRSSANTRDDTRRDGTQREKAQAQTGSLVGGNADARGGGEQSTGQEKNLAVADREAKAVQVEEIHAKGANRETNETPHPHIPVQQMPHWMRSLLKPQSQ